MKSACLSSLAIEGTITKGPYVGLKKQYKAAESSELKVVEIDHSLSKIWSLRSRFSARRGNSNSGIASLPFSFLKFIYLRVSAYDLPLIVMEVGMVTPFLPLPIMVDSGGTVGALAFVTVKPIGTPRILLLPFFLKMILMWVGLVMLRKY